MENWLIMVLTWGRDAIIGRRDGTKHQQAKRSRKQQFDDTLPVPAGALSGTNLARFVPDQGAVPPQERYRAQIWTRFVPDEGAVPGTGGKI